MKEIILDGKKINTKEELHKFFKNELDFPNYYGMNLNAFWDCLTEGFEKPTKIIWINIEDSKKKLGEDFVSAVLDLFAGTGAFGIEALSRGAAFALFVDKNKGSIVLTERNIQQCAGQDRPRRFVGVGGAGQLGR